MKKVLLVLAILIVFAIIVVKRERVSHRVIKYDDIKDLRYNDNHQIDAVVTWVDGNDPDWIAQKEFYAKTNRGDKRTDRFTKTADSDLELIICVNSILKYAPWIRVIHIVVMRGQTRPWFFSNSKINVVYHDEIWEDPNDLPVFNSLAIEANIHRIPGLSEHFLYFNDDMFLMQPIVPALLFSSKGEPIVWASIIYTFCIIPSFLMKYFGSEHQNAWFNLSQLSKENGLLYPMHAAMPLRKSDMVSAQKLFNKEWRSTAKHRFRNKNNIPPIGTTINISRPNILDNINEKMCIYVEGNKIDDNYMHKLFIEPPVFMCFNNGTTENYYKLLKKYFDTTPPL
jgi:hypothetical protein